MKIVATSLFFFVNSFCFAQSGQTIDSLLNVLEDKSLKNEGVTYTNLAFAYLKKEDLTHAKHYYKKLYNITRATIMLNILRQIIMISE